MRRSLVLVLALVLVGGGVAAEAASAKKRCPKNRTLVGKRCVVKKKKRPATTSTRGKAVSGQAGGVSVAVAPDATGKAATVKVTVSCTSAEGVAISQPNGSGETVKFTAVVNLQQTVKGQFVNQETGEMVDWQLSGLYRTPSRFEGTVSGAATGPYAPTGFSGPSCNVPLTKIVLT